MTKYFADVWKPDLFKGKVVYCTGGAGSICSAQVKALIVLGADAIIVGRSQEKLDNAVAEMKQLRPGAKVFGYSVDVRNVESLTASVEKGIAELGKIDLVIAGMNLNTNLFLRRRRQFLSPNKSK